MKISSVIALVLLVSAAFLFWQIRKRQSSERKFNNTQEFIDYMAGEAIKDAKQESHVNLDFGVESIKSVDQTSAIYTTTTPRILPRSA